MTFSKAHYFTALIPPQRVKEEILQIKREIREKYNAAHAMKLPAHITITPPVWLQNEQEKKFILSLEKITEAQRAFEIALNDYGHFGQRVIFINVVDHEPIEQFHADISVGLTPFLPETSGTIHPHITLATRDLTRENFQKAWKEFKIRSYRNSFTAEALFLLKHNGKTWDVIKEFPFLPKKNNGN